MTNEEAIEYLELEMSYLLETNGGTCKEIEADKIALIALREQSERKHGEWIEEDGIQICSECGEEHEWEDFRASYCDNCGAKMDKHRESEVSE